MGFTARSNCASSAFDASRRRRRSASSPVWPPENCCTSTVLRSSRVRMSYHQIRRCTNRERMPPCQYGSTHAPALSEEAQQGHST